MICVKCRAEFWGSGEETGLCKACRTPHPTGKITILRTQNLGGSSEELREWGTDEAGKTWLRRSWRVRQDMGGYLRKTAPWEGYNSFFG